MEEEIWIKAFGFVNYEVSNLGNVKSLFNNRHQRRDKILQLQITKNGYVRVCLRENNKSYYEFVHRLVIKSFCKDTIWKEEVNHINGIKTDNRLANLEWVTKSENVLHAYKIGLAKPCDNGFKKRISITSNEETRTYPSIREMCRVENIDRRTVRRILKGERRSYKKLTFKYI